jgi:HEAT repeat protein
VILLAATSQAMCQAEDQEKAVRSALQSASADRQRAALVLIPEMGLKVEAAARIAGELETYLKLAADDELKGLALTAYGKLALPTSRVVAVLKPYQAPANGLAVRRAAGGAIFNLANASSHAFGRQGLGTGNPESVAVIGGAGPAAVWGRNRIKQALTEELGYMHFGDDCKLILPLCAAALADADDQVRTSGADAMATLAHAMSDVLPDPITSSSEARFIDPFEAKVKWLLLQPALTALNENALALASAMSEGDERTRLAAIRATQAGAQVRALALASRRAQPDFLSGNVEGELPPEDPFKEAAQVLLPAVAARMQDPSADVRLFAVEALEQIGPGARSQLDALILATTNSDVFVRWVACRTLGGLFAADRPAEARRIVDALRERVADTDLDVRLAALSALGKGKEASQPAVAEIANAVRSGDPEQRVLAMTTLQLIKALDSRDSVAALTVALRADDLRVRRTAVSQLAVIGDKARPAIPVLRELLRDPDDEMRSKAARALLAIE